MPTYHLTIKSGKRGSATEHAAYITREGKHAKSQKKNDLITTGCGNLPLWAEENPTKLWSASDKHERKNGAAYREFEIALPAELTTEQNLALVEQFIQKEVGSKPYHFAVHAPTAAIGGVSQPHAHIMFSDRKPDDIERSPEQHFKRHNPLHPERGGCKKDSGGKDRGALKNELVSRRENWAELQNAALEKYGHDGRVDHRSNKDRGITKTAERHLGHTKIKQMTEEEKNSYMDNRRL